MLLWIPVCLLGKEGLLEEWASMSIIGRSYFLRGPHISGSVSFFSETSFPRGMFSISFLGDLMLVGNFSLIIQWNSK